MEQKTSNTDKTKLMAYDALLGVSADTITEFNRLVKRSERVYTKKTTELKEYLKIVKKNAKKANKGLKPYIGEDRCRTCGILGKQHPVTSYCFICDTDNWN